MADTSVIALRYADHYHSLTVTTWRAHVIGLERVVLASCSNKSPILVTGYQINQLVKLIRRWSEPPAVDYFF